MGIGLHGVLFCLGYYDRKLEVGGQFVRSRKRVIENFGGGKSETSVLEDWVSDWLSFPTA